MGAWGSKRNHFYGGNPNEKYSTSKKRDTEPNDLDEMSEAEMEEVEAKIVQVQMDKSNSLASFTVYNMLMKIMHTSAFNLGQATDRTG